MPFANLPDAIGDIRRFRTVVTVLMEEGMEFFVDRMRLRYLVPMRHRALAALRLRPRTGWEPELEAGPPLEVRLRRSFERLGPTFVKLGQVLSMRPDVVTPEVAAEFAKLQDAVRPLSPGTAEKIVERELGQPIENVFAEFSEKSAAAASLAQVHRAKLKDGTVVAVKVKRPSADSLVATDVRIMAFVAKLLEEHVPESRRFRPVRLVAEFAAWTMRELDFSLEGANMDRIRESFRDDEEVIIPGVHWKLVTPSVLVTDFVGGIKVDDLPGLKKAGVERTWVATKGLAVGLRMFLRDGFFHADPHPGNIVAVPAKAPRKGAEPGPENRPRVALYDFGMVGTLSERSRYEVLSCFSCFLNKDIDGFAKHMVDLAQSKDGADIEGFGNDVRSLLTGILYKPLDKKGAAFAFYHVILAGGRRGIMFPPDLILLGKAFLTVEAMVLKLDPEFDLAAAIRPQVTGALLEEFSPAKLKMAAETSVFDTLQFLKRLPEETRSLLERFEKGEVGVKIDLQELYDLKEEFDRQNDLRVLALLSAALAIGAAVIMRAEQRVAVLGLPVGEIGFIVSAVMMVWLFLLIRKGPKR